MKASTGVKKINYTNIKKIIKQQQFLLLILVVFLVLAGATVYITQLLIEDNMSYRYIENKQREVSLLANIAYREMNFHGTEENYINSISS